MTEATKDDLGGDAKAAAETPIKADPGVRDTSAVGGGASNTEEGVIASGLPLGAATGLNPGAPVVDQRPSLDVQRDAAALRKDADTLERQADVRPDSELGRLGPGGSGVGNTVAPQGYVGGQDRGGS